MLHPTPPSFLCFAAAAPDPMTVRFPEIYGDASRGGRRGEGETGKVGVGNFLIAPSSPLF